MTFSPETIQQATHWTNVLDEACLQRRRELPVLAEQAVRECPLDHTVLYLAAVAALLAERPGRCLRYLQRIEKHYMPDQRHVVLRAVAMAQQGQPAGVRALL